MKKNGGEGSVGRWARMWKGRRETDERDLHLFARVGVDFDPLPLFSLSLLVLASTSTRRRAGPTLCLALKLDRLSVLLPDEAQPEIHPPPLSDKETVDVLLLPRVGQVRLRERDQRRHGRVKVEDRRERQVFVGFVRDMGGRLSGLEVGCERWVGEEAGGDGGLVVRGDGRVVLGRGGERVERRSRG